MSGRYDGDRQSSGRCVQERRQRRDKNTIEQKKKYKFDRETLSCKLACWAFLRWDEFPDETKTFLSNFNKELLERIE